MPTLATLKNKACVFGLTVTGNKSEICQRISRYLRDQKYTEIKGYLPLGESCPKSKKDLIELLINTDKSLTTVTTVVEVERTTDINNKNQVDRLIRTTTEYRKTSIPKKLREAVWDKYIGDDIGKTKCPLCYLTDIKQGGANSWHCAHVLAEINGGQLTIENLRVICPGCNTSMGSRDLLEFASYFGKEAIERLKLDIKNEQKVVPLNMESCITESKQCIKRHKFRLVINEMYEISEEDLAVQIIAVADENFKNNSTVDNFRMNLLSLFTYDIERNFLIELVNLYDRIDSGNCTKVNLNKVKKDSLKVMCNILDIKVSNKNKSSLAQDLYDIRYTVKYDLNVKHLKEICKFESISGYGKLKRDELINALLEHYM